MPSKPTIEQITKIVELCRAAGQPEPEFEERTGSVVVRFLPGEYVAPTRVGHDLSDRQRQIVQLLSNGEPWMVKEVLDRLEPRPAKRTLQDDLSLLRSLRMIESSGRGAGARWSLSRRDRQ